MTERVEELLDQYLDLRLGGAEVEIEGLLAEHPELEERERERLRRLAELLGKQANGSTLDSEPAPPALEEVGPYRILRELGRGGQGAVFLAEDTRFARKVALKVLTRHGLELRDDPQGRESFARLKREAEVTSRLDHPGICVVYEMGAERNDLYIAMRYVEGETLAKKIADARAGSEPLAKSNARRGRPVALPGSDGLPAGPLTPPSSGRRSVERILALVEQSARALHAAHEAGVVHRDVKPGNIMVTPEGQPVLLDFGLARDLEHGTATLTASGGLLGTPAYMSPEQLSPSRGPVDRRADVYALGVTLYECLTLRRPFEAPTRELLYRLILTEQPSRAGRINASIPRDLEVVLETALEKEVDHRYQTALDLAEDLRRVRQHEPIRARPAGVRLRATRWIQRNPVLAAAFGGVFLALVSGLAVSLHLLGREHEALGRERASLAKSEGNRLIAESRAVLPTNPCLALLLAIEGAPNAPRLNANNVLLQAIGELRERRMLEAHPQMIQCLPSPDGRFLVTTSHDGTARVWDADTWERIADLEGHDGECKAVFSPDGSLLATGGYGGTSRVWSTVNWSSVHVLPEPHSRVSVYGFGPAGKHLLTSSTGATGEVANLHIWDLERETVLHTFEADFARLLAGAFSSDGARFLMVTHAVVRVWQVDVEAPRMALEIPTPVPDYWPWAILSPDGDRVLVVLPGGAELWNVTTKERLLSLDSRGRHRGPLAFRTDGQRMLVGHGDGRAEVWDVSSRKIVCVLTGAAGSASFSPDGTRILARSTGEKADGLWDAETGEQLATFQGHEALIVDAHFSRSGRRVITASNDGTLREWDLESEGQRSTFSTAHGRFVHARFDPAGKRIAANTVQGWVQVLDLDSPALSRAFQVPQGARLESLTFAPDGRSLLTTGHGAAPRFLLEHEARLWDAETGAALGVFRHPEGAHVYDAQFSPDGQLVVTAADDHKARIWDARTRRVLRELPGHASGVRSAAFGPTGKRVVTVCEAEEGASVHVWDAESGTELTVLRAEGERPIFACLSPDDRRVLAVGWEGMACVWDVASGESILRKAGYGAMTSAAFSPDGRLILTSASGVTRLWDAETFAEVMTLDGDRASFSPDGRSIVTTSRGEAHVWPVDPLQRARELAPRKLTDAERARYDLPPKQEL